MAKTLLIVESPSKAKKISKFLGSDFIVQASVGHVVDLVSAGKNNMGVDIENDFKPKYAIMPDKKDKIKVLIKYASQVDQVYLAPDPDREGEAIAWHLYDILKKKNKNIKRVSFQEITKKAVLAGVAKPRDLDRNLFDAQQARRVLDRIVGFSVSPFLINKFGPNLSAGRVQSVAVKIVVDREREIEAFDPEEYWTITSTLAKSDEDFVAKYTERVTDEKTATKIKKDLENDSYKVNDVDEFEQKKPAPPPLITSSLASAAAGKHRFTAARTMKAAQALYEAGLITYMRTDSTRIAPEAIDFCREWLKENGYDLPKTPNSYSTKGGAQDAHEAIRPTDVDSTPSNVYLPDDQQKVYSLIWERFVACQMKPALYDSVNAMIKTSSGHELKAAGKTLKYKGWLEITSDGKKDDKNVMLPPLKKNDKLKLVPPEVEAQQKFTKPPARFSEKSLIEELEKRGIGRPSTYASIMSKITNRNYVERKKSAFIPTDKGKQVVDELTKYFKFMNYGYTADMESKLDKIADGEVTYVDMMTEFYSPFQGQLKQAYMSSNKDYGFRCDKCGKDTPMYLHHGKFGYYLACINYPKTCKKTLSCEMIDEKPVVKSSRGEIDEKVHCPNCKSPMILLDGKFGPYYGCTEFRRGCKGTRKAPYGKKCPECNSELYATLYKGDGVLFCMGYHTNGCRYSEPLPKGKLSDPKKVTGKKVPKKIRKLIKK